MHGLDPAVLPYLLTIAGAATESIAIVLLDAGGRALAVHHIPSPRISSVSVPLRTVVALALAHDSHDIVMVHNHPSGDPEPSRDDVRTTRRVASALDALGIRLVDHLVLAADASVSFRARGLL
ncbi:JAB domain-containing protein [Sphingomonas radiodurans]|uniref:JAB domain-containing protein n=1 Tax=Sphingomonas radiodurans TaxID=2890321 RepID=UPI001E5A211E|nr:JAB domain-containing protein [Sphingomonas radiodurans]WBH17516.1 Mov34/MPN/PAD-1 family protein [Sphingomonas radiodurans]